MSQQDWHDKDPSVSKVLSAEHRPKLCGPSPVFQWRRPSTNAIRSSLTLNSKHTINFFSRCLSGLSVSGNPFHVILDFFGIKCSSIRSTETLFGEKKPVNLFQILQKAFAYMGFLDLFVCSISRFSCLNDFHLSSLLIESVIIISHS